MFIRQVVNTFVLVVGLFFAVDLAHAQGHKMDHGHKHGHDKPVMLKGGPNAPSMSFTLVKDAVGGWNLFIKTQNFKFAPEHASGKHIAGEGHAHLYVNGKKIARLYSAWYHIGSLPEDGASVRVSLNANDHRPIMVDGKLIEAVQMVGKKHSNHMHN